MSHASAATTPNPAEPSIGVKHMLAELTPAVLEAKARAELAALGITSTTGGDFVSALHYEAIVPTTPNGFKLARREANQSGAVPAYLFGVRDEQGAFVDVAGWTPAEDLPRLWRGDAFALGAEHILETHIEPLFVYPTVADWLRGQRQGIVILDDRRAALALDGMTLAAPTLRFARELRARLSPFAPHRPPRIVIPEAALG